MAEKYGSYPLRVIGTDQTTPMVGLPQTNISGGASAAPEILQSASQRLQGTASALAQGAQTASQISARMTENQIQANQASLQVSQAGVQAAAARAQTAGQFTGQISKMMFDYWQESERQRSAKAEAQARALKEAEQDRRELIRLNMSIEDHQRQREAFENQKEDRESRILRERMEQQWKENETIASQDFGQLFTDAQGIIHNFGNNELNDRITRTVEKWRGKVRPEQLIEWEESIRKQAAGEQDRQFAATHENTRQITNLRREEVVNRFKWGIAGIVSQVGANILDPSEGLTKIDEAASKYIADNKLDLYDSLNVRVNATKEILASGKLSFENRAKVIDYANRLNGALVEVDKLRKEEAIRPMTDEERLARRMHIANTYGLPLDQVNALTPSPTELLQKNIETQELVVKLGNINQEQFVSQANKIAFNDANVGDAVGTLIEEKRLNYNSIMSFLESPQFKGVRFWEQVKATYKDWTEYEKFRKDAAQGISKLNQQRLELRQRVLKLEAGGEDPGTFLAELKRLMIANAQSLPESVRGYAETAATRSLDVTGMTNLINHVDREYQNQAAIIAGELAQRRASMAVFGLEDVNLSDPSKSSLTPFRNRFKEQINRYRQLTDNLPAAQKVGSGATSPFNSGSVGLKPVTSQIGLTKTTDGITHRPIKAATSLQPVKWQGQTFASPFRAGTNVVISDDWGGPGSPVHARRGRSHAGLDFAVPSGTPILAPVGGQVVNVRTQLDSKGRGYGKYVDIRIPDGRVMRLAHLSGSYVQIGDEIEPGQVIAKSGDSGSPGSYHLHFEIRDGQREFYFEGSSDPKQFLALVKSGYVTAAPRRNDSVVSTYNPLGQGVQPPPDVTLRPANSVSLPFGRFISNGFVYEPTSQQQGASVRTVENTTATVTPKDTFPGGLGGLPFKQFIQNKAAVEAYNRANPIPEITVPSSIYTADVKKSNVKGNNFGYAVLAKNPRWADKIVEFADWLGVPAVWVADILHFESNLDPNNVNQFGCTGIAQFCDAQRDEFGGINKIKAAGFEGQIELLKKYFQKWGLRGQIRTMADMYLAFQRPAHVKAFQRGDYSKLDQKDGNGKSVRFYIENYIGRETGRRYRVPQDRRSSAIDTTHDKYKVGCKLCNQLVASNSPLIPHRMEA